MKKNLLGKYNKESRKTLFETNIFLCIFPIIVRLTIQTTNFLMFFFYPCTLKKYAAKILFGSSPLFF